MESVYYENMFCQSFSADEIHNLLCGYDNGYKDLLFNIFEQVLACAIGCVLAGINAKHLNISRIHFEYLERILSNKSKEETETAVNEAYQKLMDELSIKNVQQKKYIENAMPKIISNICFAVKSNTLDTVFIVKEYSKPDDKIYISFGSKMDDKLYRGIIDEITECRFSEDKLAIIKSQITSLSDLEDLLLDAQLNADEITAVLKELEDIEIAALCKRHPNKSGIEAIELSESEEALCSCLYKYILSLTQEKQQYFGKAISQLVDESEQ